MNRNDYNNMSNNMNMGSNMGMVEGMNTANFCPDCPTQTIYDPPITQYEDIYHPQLVNVVQNIETVKKHHCCPVYQHYYTQSEKNVMVSGLKRRKRAKISSKKRSKK